MSLVYVYVRKCNSYITAQTEAVLEHYRVFGHVKGKHLSAKEKQDMEDPYR